MDGASYLLGHFTSLATTEKWKVLVVSSNNLEDPNISTSQSIHNARTYYYYALRLRV